LAGPLFDDDFVEVIRPPLTPRKPDRFRFPGVSVSATARCSQRVLGDALPREEVRLGRDLSIAPSRPPYLAPILGCRRPGAPSQRRPVPDRDRPVVAR